MRSYANATSFRRALEDRLRDVARQRGVQIQGLRLKVAIERLLARLFDGDDPPWLLKGGYAMELRFRPKARTTRDLDLTMNAAVDPQDLSRRLDETHEAMQIAATVDLRDSFEFLVQPARKGIEGAPGGGGVYGVVARMAGRDFARFHIDVGFGDAAPRDVETLVGDDLMGFAGIAPVTVRAIPKAQQFAEKVHAYTVPWTDRENTRSRDLVDLLLLIERGDLDATTVRLALSDTFQHRARQPLPTELPEPPSGWREEFPPMAKEAGLSTADVRTAFNSVATYWRLLWSHDATQPD
jgi:hypothetical protein